MTEGRVRGGDLVGSAILGIGTSREKKEDVEKERGCRGIGGTVQCEVCQLS